MKKMTCQQLGGACDKEFHAETFEEMAALSKQHGTEMFRIKDPAHMEAMGKMQEMMKTPDAMQQWMMDKKSEFEALPDH